MTKSTKSNESTHKTKNDIIVKTPTASQDYYYEDDINPFKAHDDRIFNMKDPNSVTVANE